RAALCSELASCLRRGHRARRGMTIAIGGAGRGRALAMDGEIRDARMLAAHGALRIAAEPDLTHAHAEGVVGHQPADQGPADPEQELDGFRRSEEHTSEL